MAAIGHSLLYPKSEKISILRKSENFCQMYDTRFEKINAKKLSTMHKENSIT